MVYFFGVLFYLLIFVGMGILLEFLSLISKSRKSFYLKRNVCSIASINMVNYKSDRKEFLKGGRLSPI